MTKTDDNNRTSRPAPKGSNLHPTFEVILGGIRPPVLDYSDFIADRARRGFIAFAEPHIASVERVQSDLHPQGGYQLSCKKTIKVTDKNGRVYRVTVEAVDE